jgi:hypothetical protein
VAVAGLQAQQLAVQQLIHRLVSAPAASAPRWIAVGRKFDGTKMARSFLHCATVIGVLCCSRSVFTLYHCHCHLFTVVVSLLGHRGHFLATRISVRGL